MRARTDTLDWHEAKHRSQLPELVAEVGRGLAGPLVGLHQPTNEASELGRIGVVALRVENFVAHLY